MQKPEPGSYVALLRAINVSGKNKLPMADLVRLFADAGCVDVRTYIQSGNVVFRADADVASGLPALIAGRIAEGFGFRVPVIVRSRDGLADAIRRNPYPEACTEPTTLHVVFLADVPAPERVAALAPDRSPPDGFVVSGREVYLHLPNGAGKTKLTIDWFERLLGTTGTARNWRTLEKLLAMADA